MTFEILLRKTVQNITLREIDALRRKETCGDSQNTEISQSGKHTGLSKCSERRCYSRKMQRFEISLASLLEYLRGKFGIQPNNWPTTPNIDDFITSQYKGAIAPQIKEKISGRNAEDLKRKLLELADENPELGLMFWEG